MTFVQSTNLAANLQSDWLREASLAFTPIAAISPVGAVGAAGLAGASAFSNTLFTGNDPVFGPPGGSWSDWWSDQRAAELQAEREKIRQFNEEMSDMDSSSERADAIQKKMEELKNVRDDQIREMWEAALSVHIARLENEQRQRELIDQARSMSEARQKERAERQKEAAYSAYMRAQEMYADRSNRMSTISRSLHRNKVKCNELSAKLSSLRRLGESRYQSDILSTMGRINGILAEQNYLNAQYMNLARANMDQVFGLSPYQNSNHLSYGDDGSDGFLPVNRESEVPSMKDFSAPKGDFPTSNSGAVWV